MELITGGLIGGAVVYLAGSSIIKNTAKTVIKTGYAVTGAVAAAPRPERARKSPATTGVRRWGTAS